MQKSKALLLEHGHRSNCGMDDDAGSESYSSNSSFSDSQYSDGSDLANWEEYVAADGSLFYAEYLPYSKPKSSSVSGGVDRRVRFNRSSSLRLGKKPTRRQQKLHQQLVGSKHNNDNQFHQQQQQQPTAQASEVEFRFSHIKSTSVHEGNCKQLELVINAADRFRFGRRSTAVESILGFSVVPFVDNPACLMLDGFVHDIPAIQQQAEGDAATGEGAQEPIKRGDWFKSLDGIDIRTSNLDDLLLQFTEPTKVCLKFQGAVRIEPVAVPASSALSGQAGNENAHTMRKIENFAMFADMFEQILLPGHDVKAAASMPSAEGAVAVPFALLLLPPECYQHDQYKDSLYYYPECPLTNFLYKARGSFLTLNAVLSEELQTKPHTSRLIVEQVPYYVNYRTLNGFLVLFAWASTPQLTMAESSLWSDELIGYLTFAFPTLTLEKFSTETSASIRKFLRNFCDIQRVRLAAIHRCMSGSNCQFETLLKESRSMPLPKEAQLRIFDALSEMEAMDYRNWNDEPLTTHREFFIFGSVLYCNSNMLASQLPTEVRAHIEGFLRCRGIFDFIANQSVRELYVWEEIVIPNAQGRYFLTICTRSHLILAVILKLFNASDMTSDMIISPSLFYIEEIQETLDHLIQCGIESLAIFWSVSNKRPEVVHKFEPLPDTSTGKDIRKLETFLKQKLSVSNSSAATIFASGAQRDNANDDDLQFGSSLGGTSVHSLTPSEEESSRKRLTSIYNADDSDSGSDWENFAEQIPLHYGINAEGQNKMTESLWKEINNVLPVKISAGWKNSIFYYVYVDTANGTLFCPLNSYSDNLPFLHEIRKTCHVIHEVLQNTKNFRRHLADSSKSSGGSANKAVLAVKEHGIAIEVKNALNPSPNNTETEVNVQFIVVGRLFHSPLKEVYVCHRPEVPQNIVEMAFRLSFFSVG